MAEGVSLYEKHGRFQDGKSFDEQDDDHWRQLKIMQRLIVWQSSQSGESDTDPTYQLLDDDEGDGTGEYYPEPPSDGVDEEYVTDEGARVLSAGMY